MFIYFMCMSVWVACTCTECMNAATIGGQKRMTIQKLQL